MTFAISYLECASKFARHLASTPDVEVLAPGRSAGRMVCFIREASQQIGLVLPIIHTLTHQQSVELCEGSLPIVASKMLNHAGHKLIIIDDYLITGTKPKLIHDNILSRHGLNTRFEIMVSAKKHVEPYVNFSTYDPSLAIALNDQYAQRDDF